MKIKKMSKKIFILFSVSLAFLFSVCLAMPAFAGEASLYFSPASGTFYLGSTFDISIFLNTGGNDVNAVKVDLKFDPRKLQIASPTAGKSFISVWISQPTYSNINGTAFFQGGIPSPGINTSAGLVSTITFRAVAPGETSVSFLDSSQVLLDDGRGTDILTSLGRGVYAIVIPPPEGPKVFSSTHSDQNKWYKDNNPTFSWEKEEGITDFSYSIDNDFQGVPDNTPEGDHTSVSYSDLEDGFWYFHVKAKKGDIWGGTSHYLVQIDATSPADFTLVFEPVLRSPNLTSREPILSFITTDALSGLNHYELKVISLNKEKTETGFFVEIASPYKLPRLELGEYQIVVRAYDLSGNWRDVSQKIEVIEPGKIFYIIKGGIHIFGIFLSWWKVILILLLLIIFILGFILLWRRRQRSVYQRRKLLIGIKKKTKESEEEIKKRLGKT